MNAVLDELSWRGFIAHSTDAEALRARLDSGPITFYVGFDPFTWATWCSSCWSG